jgi:hypothetical protein
MGLQQFEQRLERLVEGAFAKAFRGELQPVELGRRLTREMDLKRSVAVRGLIAPNFFSVLLSEEDYERFGGFVEVLARELVDAAREHATAERYAFLGPVEVEIGRNRELAKNVFTVEASTREGEDPTYGSVVMPDGRRIALADDTLTIGRLAECEIPLADPNVSRRHAQLRRDGEAVYLVDLGSTNGTKVNGAPIRNHRLENGDIITIGVTSLRFETD